MLYKEVFAVCSESHIKHLNALSGENVEFFISIREVQNNPWALEA